MFQLTPPIETNGPWTETILYAFTGRYGNPPDGSQPNSALVPGPNGVLYGTTFVGGSTSTGSQGNGTVFEMVPPSSAGGTWSEVVLYSFTGGDDGSEPTGLALGPDGNLYGTTLVGGTHNKGTVFQLVLPPPATTPN